MRLGQQPGLLCQYKTKAFDLSTKSKPLTMVTKAPQDGAAELCRFIFYCSSPMLCNPTSRSSYCSSKSGLPWAFISVPGMPPPTWPAFSHSVLSSGTTSQRLFLTILPPQHSIPFSPRRLFISLTRTRNYLAYYYYCLPVSLSLSDCSLLYP